VATVGPCGASGCVVYVVRSGDTIGRVARRFGVSIEAILAVNPQLRDPNLIVTGQTLLLPSATP
jgi:LysM repeat protein